MIVISGLSDSVLPLTVTVDFTQDYLAQQPRTLLIAGLPIIDAGDAYGGPHCLCSGPTDCWGYVRQLASPPIGQSSDTFVWTTDGCEPFEYSARSARSS